MSIDATHVASGKVREIYALDDETVAALVDELDGLVLDEAQDLFGTGEHPSSGNTVTVVS